MICFERNVLCFDQMMLCKKNIYIIFDFCQLMLKSALVCKLAHAHTFIYCTFSLFVSLLKGFVCVCLNLCI